MRFVRCLVLHLLAAGLLVSYPVQAAAQLPLFKGDREAEYEKDHTTWVYPPWKHTWGVVRATQAHLTFFTLGKAKFINPQGLAVVKLNAQDDPDRKGDDDEVTVYGINSGENSIIYNKSMQSIGLYGYDEEGEKALSEPWDVAASPNGLVYVADAGNRRVVKLRNVNGELLYEDAFGTNPPASLVRPRGISVTGGGRVVVADAGSNRIVLFDTSGTLLNVIDSVLAPLGLEAVDHSSRYQRPREEYIVVTDSGGARLQKFDFEGNLLAAARIADNAPADRPPHAGHLTIDLYHNIVCTDSSNDRILKFDRNLRFLNSWGESGKGRSRFLGPTGITMWRRFGQTFVADSLGAHYLWIGTDLISPPGLEVDADGPILRFKFNMTERSHVRIELFQDNELARSISTIIRPGGAGFNWLPSLSLPPGGNLRDRKPLEPGEYRLRLTFRPTYSSRKVFERVLERPIKIPAPVEED
jgi:hypothetical protein